MKIVAVILIFSVIILLIPFPIAVEETLPEKTVDSGVEALDQVDGQNNFTPGEIKGQNTLQKITSAF